MSSPTPRDDSPRTRAAAALAAIGLAAAVWFSLQPERLADLRHLTAWCAEWWQGIHLYGPGSVVDYPPWAIVTLSPLTLVPGRALPTVWVAFNILLLAWIARRLSGRRPMIFLLLMAAGAMRTLNQFSLLSLALALAGTGTPGGLGPLWLGLSLVKPQIGGVFWLLALWQRQWRLSARALMVPIVLTAVYMAHARVGPIAVVTDYTGVIAGLYGGALTGQTEVTRWVVTLLSQTAGVLVAIAVGTMAFVPYARQQPLTGLSFASLFSTRHLSYDFVLLLPALAELRGIALWLGVWACMADPGAVLGLLLPESGLARHADRLLLVGVWVVGAGYLLVATLRERLAKSKSAKRQDMTK